MTECAPCYPEQVSRVVLVNTPWLFHRSWSLVKGWMAIRTQAKMCILGDSSQWAGSGMEEWLGKEGTQALADLIDRKQY